MAAEAQVARRWTGVEALDLPLPVPAGHAPLSMRFCRIPAGKFRMGARGGCDEYEKDYKEPVHEVEVPYDFWMAKYVVTQAQYAVVFEALGLLGIQRPDRERWDARPSHFKDKPNHPVEGVSWIDVTLWCQKLSEWLQAKCPLELSEWCGDGRAVCSLPTDIEWEYACRAGTETEYWCGDDDEDLRHVAWFGEDYGNGSTHSVYDPVSSDGDVPVSNAFGLVGVHGNVDEWCLDVYERSFAPHAAGRRAERWRVISDSHGSVFRGGFWFSSAAKCRSAIRGGYTPAGRFSHTGFRVCLVRGPGSLSHGGKAAAAEQRAEAEQAQQEKASGTGPPSSAAGETAASVSARHAAGAGIHDQDLGGEGRQSLKAAVGWSPAAEYSPPVSNPDGPPALVVGSLDKDQSCDCPTLDFSRFTSLRHLILWGLTDVEAIVGLPRNLERLDVRGCKSLKSLPVVTLDNLETLDLGGCVGLKDFPEGLQAPSLRWLYLDGCTGITAARGNNPLNSFLKKTRCLEELSAVDCSWIENLDGLPQQDTTAVVPSVGDPRFPERQLKKLVLRGCTHLQRLPGLSGFDWLHHLDLQRCRSLEELPPLPVDKAQDLPRGIRTLYLTGCDKLKSFLDLDIRRVHRGEAIPSAGSKTPAAADAAVNVAGQFRALSTLANERAEMRMAKVLFLGSGRCGKTTLSKALAWKALGAEGWVNRANAHKKPQGYEPSTSNIRLDAFDATAEINGGPVTTRVQAWDFGGQEIFHDTHRLFASEGAVFVIVTTTTTILDKRLKADFDRRETNDLPWDELVKQNTHRELSYWLDYVWEARGLRGISLDKPDAPPVRVLVVCTGSGAREGQGQAEIERSLCQQAGRYAPLIGSTIEVVSVDIQPETLESDAALEKISRWVRKQATGVADELGVRVPRLYAEMEKKCAQILADNQAIDKAVEDGEIPAAEKIEKYSLPDWGEVVAKTHATDNRSRREISRAVADYFHACGRVFFLSKADTVVVDQRWAVNLVYDAVVAPVAIDSTRRTIHSQTTDPFEPEWYRRLIMARPEVSRHWDFLLGLLDACNLVIQLPSGRLFAAHTELRAELGRDAEHALIRQWEAARPGAGQAALVNHSFAVHDTGKGLLLGRNAFQKIVATVAREMDGRLPRRLFLNDDEGEARDGIPRFRGSIPTFGRHSRFWRDGFQIEWLFMRTSDGGLMNPQAIPVDKAETLTLRIEWKNLSSEGGFRGGIFVQMLCSDEVTKYGRLFEYLFGRKQAAEGPTRSVELNARQSPPLAEYSIDGSDADLVIHDHRPKNLPTEVARSLRGLGSPGWIHRDGPTNNGRFDVAISYRHKSSAAFVKALHAALTDAGLLCYYDQERFLTQPGVSPDPNTLTRIYDTLRHARVLIAVPAVEYFAKPLRTETEDDNIYCPVELAEAIVAGTGPAAEPHHRPVQRHFWVRPVEPGGKPTHITRDELKSAICQLLQEHYKEVVVQRSQPAKSPTPVQVRENHSVKTVIHDFPARALDWANAAYGSEQYLDVPHYADGHADAWDFSRVIAAVKQALGVERGPFG